jgi:hypothetical protein
MTARSASGDPPVEIHRDVNLAVLRQPDLDLVLNEDAWWLPYRDYMPMWGATFAEAQECLAWERDLVVRLPQRTQQAEDELLSRDDIEPDLSAGLDLGMGAAVFALSAAGCATLVSCSGHFGEGRWIEFPTVQFAADAARVEILLQIAESADCGMTDSYEGLVEVWARTIDEMLDFAEGVIARQTDFEALPPAIVYQASEISEEVSLPQVHPGQLSFEGPS